MAWKVVLYLLFTPRIHLFACTHPSVSNTFDCNALFAYKHQSTTLVQTRLHDGSCLCTSIGLQPCVQTRLDCGSLSVHTHQSPALCFKHVWIVVPCLCARICQQPFVSNTCDYGCLCVYKYLCLEPNWLRKCRVFRVMGMVMGTSTVA